MQPAETNTQQSKSNFFVLELIRDHFTWISATTASLAPLAGIANLALFTNHIGRPDVFIRSLEFSPSLVVLALAYIAISIFVIGSMLITSFIFTLAPNYLQPEPEHSKKIIRHLFSIALIGILSVVAILSALAIKDQTLSEWWLSAAPIPIAISSYLFIKNHAQQTRTISGPASGGKNAYRVSLLTAWGCGVAVFSILPALYVMALHKEASGLLGVIEELILCTIMMIASMTPAIAFYVTENGGRAKQIKSAASSVLLLLILMMFITPRIFSVGSVGAANLLGISDRQVRHYLVDNEEYPASTLDATPWSIENNNGKKYTLTAFTLYTYGPIELLCPRDLSAIKNSDLENHTKSCISFMRSAIRPLDSVAEGISEPTSAPRPDHMETESNTNRPSS
ncbi:hypothetical protein [Azotobacter vinelandii]|uniref:hypothetical protein n=1 Tax=Azotobacter vinelandii TaxID=354 RepID=UPI000918B9B5|nr:hypothetical protein [Azotobacter vinelandii]WKN23194.1 hypothetical protein AVAEIV_001231 [Azotobacter vinelandii]SFY08998.1 hypothetical protein SAMN04244547_03935 [Azotobacter vinelandii]